MDQTAINIARHFAVEADFFSFYGSAEEILTMIIGWLKADFAHTGAKNVHLFFILSGASIPTNVILRAIRHNRGRDVKIDHNNKVRLVKRGKNQ